jgi:tetratricopeptide (TPR) repeat protein
MKATLYDTLAWMQVDKYNEDLALQYHKQALDIVAEHVNKNDPLLASYHNNVAISCSAVGQDKQAIEHYQIAIDLESSASQPDYTNIAYSYESMGTILCYSSKKYEQAMNYYERALELMLVHLPSTHPDIDSLYDSMVYIYEKQNELDQALNMLFKCLDINLKSSECKPKELVRTCRHIAEIYQKQKKFKEASVMLNKCRELEAAYPSSDDLNLENVNIDALFAKIFRCDNDS